MFVKESKYITLKNIHLAAADSKKNCCRFPVVGIYDAEDIALVDLVVVAGGKWRIKQRGRVV